jgi:hypothetical protein
MPIVNDLQQGAMEYGRVTAVLSAVIMSIFGTLMIIVSIYLLFFKKINPDFISLSAIVTQDTLCSDSNTINCSVPMSITFEGKLINFRLSLDSKNYHKGDMIEVEYDPKTGNINKYSALPKTMGIILLIVGLILISISWINVYLTKKYKSVATVEGIGQFANLVRRV